MPYSNMETISESLSSLKRPAVFQNHHLYTRRYSSETTPFIGGLSSPVANLKQRGFVESLGPSGYSRETSIKATSYTSPLKLAGSQSLQSLSFSSIDEFSTQRKNSQNILQSFDVEETKQFFKSIKFAKQQPTITSLLFKTRQAQSVQLLNKPSLSNNKEHQQSAPKLSHSSTLPVIEDIPKIQLPRIQKLVPLQTHRSDAVKPPAHNRINKILNYNGSKKMSQIVDSINQSKKKITLNSILKLPLIKTSSPDRSSEEFNTPSSHYSLSVQHDKSFADISNSNIFTTQSAPKKKRVHFTFSDNDTQASILSSEDESN